MEQFISLPTFDRYSALDWREFFQAIIPDSYILFADPTFAINENV